MDTESLSVILLKVNALLKCFNTKCRAETEAHTKAISQHKQRLEVLREEFRKKRITQEKLKTETKIINQHIADMHETKRKHECLYKECKAELLSMIDTFTDNLKVQCSKSNVRPKECELLKDFKQFQQKIKRNKVTYKDVQFITQTILQ